MTDFRLCLVIVPDPDTARKIADNIVKSKLCACVNLVPGLESIFWWQGKVETSNEVLLLIKTQQSQVEALDTRVRELHPYAVYEFIALPLLYGNADYLSWVKDSIS